MARRLKISLKKTAALEMTRIAIGDEKLVYVLMANKKLSYPNGKSSIAYIGTTKKGVSRIAESAAYRAEEILTKHGITSVVARIVTSRPRQNVKTWMKLERAMLLTFRSHYGAVPLFNSHGKKMVEVDEFEYFSRERVRGVVLSLDA